MCTWHTSAVVGALGVCTDRLVGAVIVLHTGALVKVINGHPGHHDV